MTAVRFGRYEIIDELAQGGMATVYRAHDPYVKRDVAVKVLSTQLTADPTFQQRFQFEAETIAALEHPSIVPIYDFGRQDSHWFIVMRYMPGGSLQERLPNGPMTLKDAAPIIERVALALEVAHAKGIVHRDIKPANIMFNAGGEALLSDFGIAIDSQQPAGLTEAGSFIGTVEFMSPEQIQGAPEIDGRSDIYSLGVVLFLILTGVLPYQRSTVFSTALAHLSDPIPSVQSRLPNSRVPWDDVVQKALAKSPEDRYQHAADMATDVKALRSGKWYLSRLDSLLD